MNEPGLEDNLITIVNVIGIVQAVFVAAALLRLPGRHRGANHTLALLLAVFAVMFTYDIFYQYDLMRAIPHMILVHLPLVFLYGPLVWFYLRRITAVPGENVNRNEWLHFIPFALVLLCYAPSLVLSSEERSQAIWYVEDRRRLPLDFQLSTLQAWLLNITAQARMPLFALQLCAYLVASWRLLARHRLRIREHFSYTGKISLNWVRNLLFMLIGMWLQVLLKEFIFRGVVSIWINDLLVVEQVVFVFLIGLFGLLQVSIFDRQERLPDPMPPAPQEPASGKYQNSSLLPVQREAGLQMLMALMEKEKPYLNSELTIADLATNLALPARHVSQIINASLGKNFLDFVNAYRVDAAKRYLDDANGDMSILEIAMEVGFNSKSAFYNAFKRHAGMTPTQYRQNKSAATASLPAGFTGN